MVRVVVTRAGPVRKRVKPSPQPKTVPPQEQLQMNEYLRKFMQMVQKETGMGMNEQEPVEAPTEVKEEKPKKKRGRKKGSRKRGRKTKKVSKQEAIEEKLKRIEEQEPGTLHEEYVTFGEPSLTPPEAQSGTESQHGKGMKFVEEHPTNTSKGKEENEGKENINIYDVPESIKHELEHLSGPIVGVTTVNGQTYIRVGEKIVKSIPPDVDIQDNKIVIRTNPEVLKQYASLARGKKIAVAVNIGNNRAILTIYVDKNGNISIPPTEKKAIQIEPDGTIVVDIEKALPKYFLNRLAKKGGKLKINVGYWGRFAGINAPVAGKTITVDVVPEEEEG